MARRELGPPLVIFPDFMVSRLARLGSQRSLFQNVAFRVAIQLQKLRLLAAIPTIGQDDQYFSLHNVTSEVKHLRRAARRQSFWLARLAGGRIRRLALREVRELPRPLGRHAVGTEVLFPVKKSAVWHLPMSTNIANFLPPERCTR